MHFSVDYNDPMLGTLLWNLDFLIAVLLCLVALTAITVWKGSVRKHRATIAATWGISFFLLFFAALWMRYADLHARDYWNTVYRSISQSYETSLEMLGHGELLHDASAETTPLFQRLLKICSRWQDENPLVACICTFYKVDAETYVYLLGPESDYNKDGKSDLEIEHYYPPGTVYLYNGEIDEDLAEAINLGTSKVTAVSVLRRRNLFRQRGAAVHESGRQNRHEP